MRLPKFAAQNGRRSGHFKYISDQADHAAPQDWLLALNHAALAFSARVQQGI